MEQLKIMEYTHEEEKWWSEFCRRMINAPAVMYFHHNKAIHAMQKEGKTVDDAIAFVWEKWDEYEKQQEELYRKERELIRMLADKIINRKV